MDLSYRRRPTESRLERALARLVARCGLPEDPITRLDLVPEVDLVLSDTLNDHR